MGSFANWEFGYKILRRIARVRGLLPPASSARVLRRRTRQMPASARVLLLLAPALLVQQAHCSEVSELCTEGPMALGLASEGQPPSSRNPDKLYVYSLISCALVVDSGIKMPAVIRSSSPKMTGDQIITISYVMKVDDHTGKYYTLFVDGLQDDVSTGSTLTLLPPPPSSSPLAPLPPSPPPLPPNYPGLPKGCAIVPVVAEHDGENTATAGTVSFFVDRMPCSHEANGRVVVGVGYVDVVEVQTLKEIGNVINVIVQEGLEHNHAVGSPVHFMPALAPPNAPPPPLAAWEATQCWETITGSYPASTIKPVEGIPQGAADGSTVGDGEVVSWHADTDLDACCELLAGRPAYYYLTTDGQNCEIRRPPDNYQAITTELKCTRKEPCGKIYGVSLQPATSTSPPHPPLFPTIAPPLAPFPPAVPSYPAGAATKKVTVTLTAKPPCPDDDVATASLVAKRLAVPSDGVVTFTCTPLAETARRRRLADADVAITITIPTTESNHDSVLSSATTLFQDEEAATALLGVAVYSGASVAEDSSGGADKDPHLAFPHGGTADFRGRDGVFYNFLSAPGLAVNIKTEESLACRAPAHRPALL